MFGIRIQQEAFVYDENLPMPALPDNHYLIKTAYAGMNRADLFQMQGNYAPPAGASLLPGLEVSGAIVDTKGKNPALQTGDLVCALLPGGGYAEYVAAPFATTLPLPAGWNLPEAAILPEALYTNWLALFTVANCQPGDTVLMHGGASGLTSLASQLASAASIRMITTASSDEKCAFSRRYNAHDSIHYQKHDFAEYILSHYGKLDAVIDFVGGDYSNIHLSLLKPKGRLISLACLRGAECQINMGKLLMKQLSWHGVTLRNRSLTEKAALTQEIREKAWPWLENGLIRPALDREYALHEADKAIKRLEQNLNLGKIRLKA